MHARANIPDASDTVVFREYEYHFPDGHLATFAVILYRSDDTETAKLARDRGALAHGLVSVGGLSGAPLHPVVWLRLPNELLTMVEDGDPAVSDDLHRMLVKVMKAFFKDVSNVAPDLAALGVWG